MEFLSQYVALDLFWIGLSFFLIGMSKGGFLLGSIALPILILVWPSQTQAARVTAIRGIQTHIQIGLESELATL